MDTDEAAPGRPRRDMRIHEFHDWSSLASGLPCFAEPFICLFVCDAEGIDVYAIADAMKTLIQSHCRCIVCWGPDCERVHDIADEVFVGLNLDDIDSARFVDTTWHSREPLEEALWYAMYCARIEEDDPDGISPILAICERQDNWFETIRRAFEDPEAFNERLVDSGF